MSIEYRTELSDFHRSAAELARLWTRNLDGCDDVLAQRKLSHGYLDNPAGDGVAILLRAPGLPDAVGAQGLHERRVFLGGQVLRAACMADFVVDAAHRSLGPALLLMKRAIEQVGQGFDLVYGLPNRKAAAVCARAGLVRVGEVRRYVKLLQTRDRLASRLPAPAASAASLMADRLLALADHRRRWRHARRWTSVGLAWGDTFADEIWARRPDDLLLSERSSAVLSWRFGAGRDGRWRLLGFVDGGGAPAGWVVWRRDGQNAEVGDFFVTDPARNAVAAIAVLAATLRKEGLAGISMEMLAPPDVEAALLAAGMSRRDDAMPVFARVAPEGGLQLPAPERWYLTRFDNDSD